MCVCARARCVLSDGRHWTIVSRLAPLYTCNDESFGATLFLCVCACARVSERERISSNSVRPTDHADPLAHTPRQTATLKKRTDPNKSFSLTSACSRRATQSSAPRSNRARCCGCWESARNLLTEHGASGVPTCGGVPRDFYLHFCINVDTPLLEATLMREKCCREDQ